MINHLRDTLIFILLVITIVLIVVLTPAIRNATDNLLDGPHVSIPLNEALARGELP